MRTTSITGLQLLIAMLALLAASRSPTALSQGVAGSSTRSNCMRPGSALQMLHPRSIVGGACGHQRRQFSLLHNEMLKQPFLRTMLSSSPASFRPARHLTHTTSALRMANSDSDGFRGLNGMGEGDGDDDGNANDSLRSNSATGQIMSVELNEELKTSFMSYAMSTILGRALPDARDGLKPVHRRVLYAMMVLNLTPENSHRKCARVVGEVLGKYHPHGDQSVYDALVRMAQDFVMLHPLVAGHGNFGSVDNDPPAAMRYTEARLASFAFDTLLADIKEGTVDFIPNFDGSEMEPVVLPARLPLLLLNGASGIAVGMATNIPPHNLGEIADAMVALVDNPDLSEEELFKIVPAPDFPTGGKIVGGLAAAQQLYRTGHGSIIMRAKSHVELLTNTININSNSNSNGGGAGGAGDGAATGGGTRTQTRSAIVITELPYMTNKSTLLEKIAELVNEKKLDGISDLRDESDRDGIRVVIELKRDAVPAIVQNNLYKKTPLQTSFPGNMLALVEKGTQPKRVTLKYSLEVFLDFRFKTIRRRTAHQLSKLQARDHLVTGMIRAITVIDKVIALMKSSADSSTARETLMSKPYNFSLEQAEAILSLTLRRLTAMEDQKLKKEHEELEAQIQLKETIMKEDSEVYRIIKEETLALKAKHAVPRRTELSSAGEDAILSDEDLLANDRSVILITASGYIKRVPVEEFGAQSRGGKGKAGTRLSSAPNDAVAQFFTCNDHDAVIFVTNKGISYSVKAYQVPLGSRTARGVPLPQVLPIASEERVTSVIPVPAEMFTSQPSTSSSSSSAAKEDSDEEPLEMAEDTAEIVPETEHHLVLLTSRGYVKKTPLNAFQKISARGLTIISLEEGDSLSWARLCSPEEEVLIATKKGYASRFTTANIMSTGRKSRGVRALNLREGDSMADMDILQPSLLSRQRSGDGDGASSDGGFVLALTEKGYGKRVSIEEFRTQKRGGKGVIIMKFKAKAGGADALSCMRVCSSGDEVVMSTKKGTVIRQRVDDISEQQRATTGVLVQRLAADDIIQSVDIVPADQLAEQDQEESEELEEEMEAEGKKAKVSAASKSKKARGRVATARKPASVSA